MLFYSFKLYIVKSFFYNLHISTRQNEKDFDIIFACYIMYLVEQVFLKYVIPESTPADNKWAAAHETVSVRTVF